MSAVAMQIGGPAHLSKTSTRWVVPAAMTDQASSLVGDPNRGGPANQVAD